MKSADLADIFVRAVLTFDPSQNETRYDEILGQRTSIDSVRALRAYLSKNECSWLYRRRTGERVRQTLATNSVILYGEAGTGKTSLLREMQCTANRTNAVPLLIIDLHQIEGRVRAAPDLKMKRRLLTEFVVSRLSEALAKDLADPEVQLTLKFRLASGNDNFADMQAAIKLDVDRRYLDNRTAFGELLEGDIMAALFRDCYTRYLKVETPFQQQIAELYALAETPGRRAIVVAFDNVDRLDEKAQDECAEMARSISASSSTLLPVILTCRTRNMRRLKEIANTLNAEAFPTRPYMKDIEFDSNNWAIAGIFRRRLDILRSDDFWNEMDVLGGVRRDLRQEMDRMLRRVDEVFDKLWPATIGELAPTHAVELGQALTRWHRGNVREISVALYSIIRSITVDPSLMPKEAGDVSGKRVKNLLYRSILGQTSRFGKIDGHSAVDIDDYLQVFLAHPEPTSHNQPPFYFLKFRMLRFMATQPEGHRFVRTELYKRFSFYGVDKSSVDSTLRDLLSGSSVSPSLIYETSSKKNSKLEILDTGRYLVENLVSKCEYLYASAISVPRVYTAMAADPRLPNFKRLVKVPPSDELKVLVSAFFVLDYLMPRFHDEHPYLLRDDFNINERKRVERFRTDFGFDINNWFINQLVSSIQAHANESDVAIPRDIGNRLNQVIVEGHRLDRMLRVS